MTQKQQQSLLTLSVLLGIIMYAIPWLVAPSSGLSFGANDLAEWASLHPENRATTPPMLTSLLLRLPLACLIIAYNWATNRTWLTIVITGGVLILLLPPLEILTSSRNDINYIQQTFIVGFALLGSIIKIQSYLMKIILIIVGMISSIIGVFQAYELMKKFQLSIYFGTGFIAMVGLFIGIILLLWHTRQGKNLSPTDEIAITM